MPGSVHPDVRYALRNLRQRPGFTAVALTTLALGIGANVAIFSVANAVLFRPLDVPEEARLVRVTSASGGLSSSPASLPHFNILREQMGPFDAVAAHRLDFLNFTSDRTPEQVAAARVTEGFFRIFGASPIAGRLFTEEDDRPGGSRVAVLSGAFWLSRFAGDKAAIGQRLTLGGEPYIIVGVVKSRCGWPWVPSRRKPDRTSPPPCGAMSCGATAA